MYVYPKFRFFFSYCEKVWFLIVIDWWVCVWDCVWMLGNNHLWVYWGYMFIPCFGFWLWKSFNFYCYWLMGMRLRLCLNAGKMCGKEMDGRILYWGFFCLFVGEWVCMKTVWVFGCGEKCWKRVKTKICTHGLIDRIVIMDGYQFFKFVIRFILI